MTTVRIAPTFLPRALRDLMAALPGCWWRAVRHSGGDICPGTPHYPFAAFVHLFCGAGAAFMLGGTLPTLPVQQRTCCLHFAQLLDSGARWRTTL